MTDWAITIGIIAVLAIGAAVVSWIRKRRREARQRIVELEAAVAADDDPAFAPDAAARLFVEAQDARDRCDRAALAEPTGVRSLAIATVERWTPARSRHPDGRARLGTQTGHRRDGGGPQTKRLREHGDGETLRRELRALVSSSATRRRGGS